jgi:hypothetical protein
MDDKPTPLENEVGSTPLPTLGLYKLEQRFFKLEDECGGFEVRIYKLQKAIKSQNKEIEELEALIKRKRKPTLIFTTIINNKQIKILKIMPTLDLKTFVDTVLALEDTDTKAPITATFANIAMTSSDTSIFTADSDVNADGTVDIVGVAAGTATLTVTADASYTDGNTGKAVTANKSATIDVTVSEPLPGDENTDMIVSFGAPSPVS